MIGSKNVGFSSSERK